MITRADDTAAVAEILNHPKVFGTISDDSSLGVVEPDLNELYIINEDKSGIVKIDHFNSVTCAVHIATLPSMWGKTVPFGKGAVDWIFGNTSYLKIISFVPDSNRLALRFGKKCGFAEEGRLKRSISKDFKLQDQIIIGLSKRDYV